MAESKACLYYSGFNSHLRLQSTAEEQNAQVLAFNDSSSKGYIPPDVTTFTRVHASADRISLLSSTWCDTVFLSNNVLYHAGHRPRSPASSISGDDLKQVFGDPIDGFAGAVTTSGELFVQSEHDAEGSVLQKLPLIKDGQPVKIDGAAVSGDGQFYVVCRPQNGSVGAADEVWLDVMKWPDVGSEGEPPVLTCNESIRSVVAGSTAVAVLSATGVVLTSGSPLQPSLLARTPTKEHSARALCPVDALGGIQIVKICMCEWLGGALSAESDLYLWGGRGGERIRIDNLSANDEDVNLVDIAGGVDIADFAIGMGHVLVLTADGEVWGCGENEYGQLGLGEGQERFVPGWSKIPMSWQGHTVQEVGAGGYGSWLVTDQPLDF